jgi:Cu/Ag efflux protein CusF
VVRQVRELPDGRSQLSVHHEEIADFVSINGEVIGMKSMTMPFSVAESVDLTGVQAGSKISFALSVDWSRTEPALIESLEILTEEAVLELGPGT